MVETKNVSALLLFYICVYISSWTPPPFFFFPLLGVCGVHGMAWPYWTAYFQFYWWSWKGAFLKNITSTTCCVLMVKQKRPPASYIDNQITTMNTSPHFSGDFVNVLCVCIYVCVHIYIDTCTLLGENEYTLFEK